MRRQLRDWSLVLLMFQHFLVFLIADYKMILETFGMDALNWTSLWSYQRSSVIVLFFFLLDCRFLKRVSEEMGKMLKEVTCSCFWGGGVRVVRLRESERSKLHECMQT